MVRIRYFLKRWLSNLVLYFILIFFTSNGILFAQSEIKKISIALGQTEILAFNKIVKRVSISNPDVADATVISTSQLLINGKQLGTTTMIVSC